MNIILKLEEVVAAWQEKDIATIVLKNGKEIHIKNPAPDFWKELQTRLVSTNVIYSSKYLARKTEA